MTKRHSTRMASIAAVVLIAVVAALLLAACGGSSDKYSGTWTGTVGKTPVSLKIVKSGDKWTLSDPTAKGTQSTIQGSEEGGKLVIKNPSNASQTMTFERKDDTLVMNVMGTTVTLKKQ